MKLIGIAGCDGSGKTTLAESLREIYGDKGKSAHINFADKLKDELAFVFSCYENDEDDEDFSSIEIYRERVYQKPTPEWLRLLLRGWGNYKRSLKSDYWVNKWINEVVDYKYRCDFELKQECFVVCSDVRYLNEAKAVHELGGKIVFLEDRSRKLESLSNSELHELDKIAKIADLGCFVSSKDNSWARADEFASFLGL